MERTGILLVPTFLILGLFHLHLGILGLDATLGTWGAIAGIVASAVFRIFLPITIGTYFGATLVFGWPWWIGVLCALPGLAFMAPVLGAAALGAMLGR